MPVKRNYPTYQPPNYRGMPGTTPPFIPEPIPQNGQVQPPSPDPALPPYMQQPGQVSQPQDQRTILQKLRDPRFAGMLISMGAALGQPKQFGQTGWGQAAQAMAQGYNFLGMSQAAQEAAKRQHWEDQIRMQELAMKQQTQATDIEDKKSTIESRKNTDILNRDKYQLEGKKVDSQLTETEHKIANMEEETRLKAQDMKDKLTQAERHHAETMKRLDDARAARESQTKIQQLMLEEKISYDKLQNQRELNRQAFLQQDAGVKNAIAKQRADAATTAANAAAGRSTVGSDKSNPEFIRLMGIIKQDPENFGLPEEELVAKTQRLFQALPNQRSTPAGPKMSVNGNRVTVEGQGTLEFPTAAAAMKYIELKSKERK